MSTTAQEPRSDGGRSVLRQIAESSWLAGVAAAVLALVIGAVFIAATDKGVQDAAGYFFARPGDLISRVASSIGDAYSALFQGAVYDLQASTAARAFQPVLNTMTFSTPLILAGLGLAVAFRSGMFNIGAQGQIILGAVFGGYVGFAFHLPVGLHLVLALAMSAVGGALWASIAGVLKATTGAHEVIVTIMLNNIAGFLIAYLLRQDWYGAANTSNPISPPIESTALLPAMFGNSRLHWGFVLALLAAVGVWWLLERSTLGFQLRAVGENPHAARTAGISVARVTVVAMALAGALAGLAGAAQVLGTEKQVRVDVAASFGFDAITVALLGRSRPLGTVLAGLLFGALRAGGYFMQSRTGTPIDIILILQSLIVLFIAAPPLVRTIFRLPAPGRRRVTEVAA